MKGYSSENELNRILESITVIQLWRVNKEYHEGIILKEQFEAVQLEMASRSNVEVLEDGTVHRKNKKYSSNRGKQ